MRDSLDEDQYNEQLLSDLTEAFEAWKVAVHHFNEASEPDIIDDAIFLLIAAEKRYEGLLRIARRKNLVVGFNGEIIEAPERVQSATRKGRTASL